MMIASIGSVHAQIPNAGFEDWTTVGSYQDPVQWGTLNAATSLPGVGLSCEKGTPGAVGNAYVKLTTRNIPGVGNLASELMSQDADGAEGFPFAGRPQALNGVWKHAIMPNDSGLVMVSLTKYDLVLQSDAQVGIAGLPMSGTQSSWQAFSAPIHYLTEDVPDKAVIVLLSSVGIGADGSTLSVDDLSFGDYTGIQESNAPAVLSIHPTLATDELIVNATAPMTELVVLDLTGRTMETVPCDRRKEEEVAVADLAAGRYLLNVYMADGTRQVRSFVKQ